MAKGIVKGIGSSTPKSVAVTTTVVYDTTTTSKTATYDGTTPVGDTMKGTIQDIANPAISYDFEQPFGTELGLAVGLKVNFNTILVNGVTVASAVRLVERGVVETVNATNDGGTLMDRASKKLMNFVHPNCKESGILAPNGATKGSVVSFDRVVDPRTAETVATALDVIK